MAISINWPTSVIFVPKTDMTLIQSSPTEIRQLDLNVFRLALKDLEDDVEGMPFPKTHNHNTEITLGGLTFSRVIEILPPYTITFQNEQYAVNLVGANSNVGDRVNVNQVSVRSANSAGLLVIENSVSAVTQQNIDDIANAIWGGSVGGTVKGSFGAKLRSLYSAVYEVKKKIAK